MFFNVEENKTRRLQKHRVMEVLTTGPPNSRQRFDRKIWQEFLVLCAGTFSISVPTWCEIFSAFCAQKKKKKKRVCVGSTGVLAQAGILPGMQSCCITAGLWMICD